MTKTLKKIEESASTIHNKITKKQKPSMDFPIRALSNVKYIPHIGIALKEILDLNDKQEQKVIYNLTDILERSRS